MTTYEVDYSYMLPEFGALIVEAESIEHAEAQGILHVKDTYPDAMDIEIDAVRELKDEAPIFSEDNMKKKVMNVHD